MDSHPHLHPKGQSRKAVIDDGGNPFHSVLKDDLPTYQLLNGALGP
jgi:hypothetical protein